MKNFMFRKLGLLRGSMELLLQRGVNYDDTLGKGMVAKNPVYMKKQPAINNFSPVFRGKR